MLFRALLLKNRENRSVIPFERESTCVMCAHLAQFRGNVALVAEQRALHSGDIEDRKVTVVVFHDDSDLTDAVDVAAELYASLTVDEKSNNRRLLSDIFAQQ